jgi:hypothetical protein
MPQRVYPVNLTGGSGRAASTPLPRVATACAILSGLCIVACSLCTAGADFELVALPFTITSRHLSGAPGSAAPWKTL